MVAHLGVGMPGERIGARVAAVGANDNQPARRIPRDGPPKPCCEEHFMERDPVGSRSRSRSR